VAVPLLDLTAQYRALRDELDEAVARVVRSQGFVLGPEVEGLEDDLRTYLGVPHAIGVASGTDALLLPLMALEPEPGDEVVVPAFTFFATAGAVWNAGFRPVFCDVDPVTFNVTRETVEAAWTDRTRAVIPVHLFGQMVPLEDLLPLARSRSALVLEDAAQAIGARRSLPSGEEVMAGAAAPVGALSFFPTKNLGAFGDGGMVTARDPDLAETVRKLRVHGGRQMYRHELVGTNSRLDALQAAVLRAKLPHLEAWTVARRAHACAYGELFEGLGPVRTPGVAEGNFHVYNQYTLRVERRDELRRFLSDRGVGTGVYYPVPLHLQPCFAELGYREGDLPVSEALCREVLSLPVFPELSDEGRSEVAAGVRAFYGALS
jgi:dTDP-4-amino-4,6-dideoxygalactose transaminase